MKEEMKGKITYGSWGLVLGATILFTYGFGLDGWATAKTTQKMIADAVLESQTATQSSICVAQFMQNPSNEQNLVELQKLAQAERSTFIDKGGWDKMPGQKEAGSGVAQACSYGLEDFMKK